MSSLHKLDVKISSAHQPIDSNGSAMAIGVSLERGESS
jgi:hypothetical protein